MHNTDSFIDEVSEAVRRDRVARTLRRYGWVIAAVVLFLVGGAAVNEWMKLHTARIHKGEKAKGGRTGVGSR